MPTYPMFYSSGPALSKTTSNYQLIQPGRLALASVNCLGALLIASWVLAAITTVTAWRDADTTETSATFRKRLCSVRARTATSCISIAASATTKTFDDPPAVAYGARSLPRGHKKRTAPAGSADALTASTCSGLGSPKQAGKLMQYIGWLPKMGNPFVELLEASYQSEYYSIRGMKRVPHFLESPVLPCCNGPQALAALPLCLY